VCIFPISKQLKYNIVTGSSRVSFFRIGFLKVDLACILARAVVLRLSRKIGFPYPSNSLVFNFIREMCFPELIFSEFY
jgi:hypothetical protein